MSGGSGYPPPGYPPHQQNYPTGGGLGYPQQQPPYPGDGNQQNIGFVPSPAAPAGAPIGFNPSFNAPYQPYGAGPYPPTTQQTPYPSAVGSGDRQQPTPFGGEGAYMPMQQQQQSPYPFSQPPQQQQSPYPSSHPPYNYQQQTQPMQQQHFGGQSPAAGGGAMVNPSIRPNPNFNASLTAELLRKAMKGFGCDNRNVLRALININNAQRQEVIRVFKQMYGKDLISNIKSELSGDFENLILALMKHPANYDADQLARAMEGLGTKEHVLIEIMTTRNNAQIFQIKNAYRQLYGADLEGHLIGETSGYFKRLLISLCSGARDESGFADPVRANQDAKNLYRSGEARLGTDEIMFNSILASQNYTQLRLVFNEYQKISGHSFEQAIHAEFSGDVKDGLLAIVKSVQNRPSYFSELLYNAMKGFGTRDNDLIRIIVTRSEIDLGDIRNNYQQIYGVSLEQAITSDCSGAYKEGLIAIVKGFYN